MLNPIFEEKAKNKDTLNYFCTWQMQNSILNKDFPLKENAQKRSGDGKNFPMNMIDYDLVFKKGGYLDEFPDEREHLYFMLDYAWDIDFISDPNKNMQYFGGLELSKEKFPSIKGTPQERLKTLNDMVKARGWKGLLLWVPTQPEGFNKKENFPEFDKNYWREKFLWLKFAEIEIIKLDLGAFMHDVSYRKRIEDIKNEVYPELIIEQTICPSPLSGNIDKDGRFIDDTRAPLYTKTYEFSSFFRSGDVSFELGDVTTLDRLAHLLKKPNNHISCEDCVIIAAALGLSFGLMRSSVNDTVKDKQLKEVTACVNWHRFAPPFTSGYAKASDKILYSSYSYGETWVPRAANKTVIQGAPKILARNTLLPDATGTRYIVASQNPSKAYSVASIKRPSKEDDVLPKVICYPEENTEIFGIFGDFKKLSFKINKPRKIYMQNLINGDVSEESIIYKDGMLVFNGDILEKYRYIGDESENSIIMRIFY